MRSPMLNDKEKDKEKQLSRAQRKTAILLCKEISLTFIDLLKENALIRGQKISGMYCYK